MHVDVLELDLTEMACELIACSKWPDISRQLDDAARQKVFRIATSMYLEILHDAGGNLPSCYAMPPVGSESARVFDAALAVYLNTRHPQASGR
ncbi:MAG: hypothetical protein AAGA28_09310 [Pseudomonadota bacterium]